MIPKKKKSKLDFRPDGVIITLSAQMFRERGYRNWLTNFLFAMSQDDYTYYFRTSAQPTLECQYLYICAGGRIRYRCNLIMTEGAMTKTFLSDTGNGTHSLYGRAWLICAGPVAVAPHKIFRKGFQGFRYTEQFTEQF